MSQKWHRSRKWDDEHLTGWARPIKFLLRTFSSITLAVILLSLVVVYATLASVPIGMLALIPTYLVYGLTLAAVVAVVAALPAAGLRLGLRSAGRAVRFAAPVFAFAVLSAAAVWVWHRAVWPELHYDPATKQGFRLFAGFAEQYRATTLRRLPGLEMSELEFYSWWPLRIVLLAFVANMIVATARRIEFTFVNLGVLTVHTGIVVMAMGSVFYKAFKQEGDTILIAGHAGADGLPTIGPPQVGFYDNIDVALWIDRGAQWEQRPLPSGIGGVPRYNDYGLNSGSGQSVLGRVERLPDGADGGRTLGIPVPPSRRGPEDGFSMRVVGYASYAEPAEDWVRVDPATVTAVRPDQRLNPVRFVELLSGVLDREGNVPAGPVMTFYYLPGLPAHRVSENSAFAVEYTIGMPADRWEVLRAELPERTGHALVVEVPGQPGATGPFRAVYPAQPGGTIVAGQTGYTVTVQQIAPQPPFPIITEGYRGAQSSVAIVRVTTPAGETFDRYVYHRFPEINQDMLQQLNERGMPTRRDADPAIKISYIDASKLQVYLDETADGSVRAIVREPGGRVRTMEGVQAGGTFEDVVEKISLRLADRWEHAERLERPVPVPEQARQNDQIGTHGNAMLGVEVAVPREGGEPWRRVVWLPFTKYLDVGMGTERTVDLPDGRQIKLAFGRRRHPLPGFMVQLVDFEMIAYDHRGAPRDYQSVVRVSPTAGMPRLAGGPEVDFAAYEHVTKLNAPLQAPFMWSQERSWFANTFGLLASRLNPRQFKFSQAGWDAQGWEQNQARADRGEIPRPFANFTILGVGNNPGIHVIALGAIMVAVGTPWAFYVKPLLVKRQKRKIQRQLASGTYQRPRERAAEVVAS